MRPKLLAAALLYAAAACGEAFESGSPGAGGEGGAAAHAASDPGGGAPGGAGTAAGGGTAAHGGAGATGGATTSAGGGGSVTTSTASGGAGGEGPSAIPAACAAWCASYDAMGCEVPNSGDCQAECLARFAAPSGCDAVTASLLDCYASVWNSTCTVPDLCLDQAVEWADCLTNCTLPTCSNDASGDVCGCSASCATFSAEAECSRYNVYCYCRFSGPLDLGPDPVTVQTLCFGTEIVCSSSIQGCCGAIFY